MTLANAILFKIVIGVFVKIIIGTPVLYVLYNVTSKHLSLVSPEKPFSSTTIRDLWLGRFLVVSDEMRGGGTPSEPFSKH